MYLIIEYFKENNIEHVKIENTENKIQMTCKVTDIKSTYEKLQLEASGNNCFNFNESGYTHGILTKLPGKDEFHKNNKVFLISKVSSNNVNDLYIIYTKNGFNTITGINLRKYCKLGLVLNAHLEIRDSKEIIKMNRGKLKLLPIIPYVDYSKLVEYDYIIHRNIEVIESLLAYDKIIKSFVLDSEYKNLSKKLDKYNLRYLFRTIQRLSIPTEGYNTRALNTLVYRLPLVIDAYNEYDKYKTKQSFEYFKFEYTMMFENLLAALQY